MQGGPGDIRSLTPRSVAGSSADATDDFLFHLYRGSDLLRDSRVAEAKEELERALKFKPRDPKGQDLLAVVYFRLGLYPRAIEIYEELVVTFPGDPALIQNLALCFLKTGQPERARTLLEPLVLSQPDHTRAWGYLGLVHERLGEYEKARIAFERGGQTSMARRMDDLLATAASTRSQSRVRLSERTSEADSPSHHPSAPSVTGGITISYSGGSSSPNSVDSTTVPTFIPTSFNPSPPPPRHEADLTFRPTGTSRHAPEVTYRPTGSSAARTPTSTPTGSDSPLQALGLSPNTPNKIPLPPLVGAHPHFPSPWSAAPIPPDLWAELAPNATETARRSRYEFPTSPGCAPHDGGIVLARIDGSFATRSGALRAIRSEGHPLRSAPLPRRERGRKLEEPVGPVSDPFVLLSGRADVTLGPRPRRRLVCLRLTDELIYLREDCLVGFDGAISYENGRVSRESEATLSLVQLRGNGSVVFEVIGSLGTLEISAEHPVALAEDALVGWTGRLLPHEPGPDEGFDAKRDIVAFSGEGIAWMSTGSDRKEG